MRLLKLLNKDKSYLVLIFRYREHPRQNTTETVITTTTSMVTPRPGSAALFAGLNVEGAIVVELCFSILAGG